MLRIAFAAALACAFSAHAQDNVRTRQLASACAICHGTDGRGDGKVLPPLAGMPREHIASQMRAFRDGQRPATVMHQIAKGYTDEQIDALAAWFAAQKR
ncbi:MAG: cytochrome subunit of sulfide dehydrogenase [Betaproteobacteria bacterium]|jgi:cytochrome c553|nr:cytochrome subunit of sulfide dehydrogenase [Betaproteobacteria bacterium]